MSRALVSAAARTCAGALLIAALTSALTSASALAGPVPAAEPVERPSSARRGAALAASLVPVNGSGHYVLGHARTARRLLILQGLGLGAVIAGGLPLVASGASRKLVLPALPVAIGGGGAMLLGWLADIYGAAGGARLGGGPEAAPAVELEGGYALVDDAQFPYRDFAVVAVRARYREFELRPRAWVSTTTDHQRWSGELAYRRRSNDGSFVEAGLAANRHHDGVEGFTVVGIEAFAAARLHLERIGPSLRGAFADLLLGVGSEHIGYRGLPDDWNGNLLAHYGFGVYLGRAGEVSVYYDHRRDDYAGGLAAARGGGFFGHFGVAGKLALWDRWGLVWELERGAANVARLGLSYRLGAP